MNDTLGRNFLGTPPQGRADYAFFQHILASMDDVTGRCAILFPHGVLFRDEEVLMRESLIERDWLDCVIGLGPNLFFNASMEACVIICKKQKEDSHKGKVLFIDAKAEVTRKNSESFLEPQHIQKIIDAYKSYKDIDGFSAAIDNSALQANKSLLGIQYYVHSAVSNNALTIDDEYQSWQMASNHVQTLYNDLLNLLENGKV